MPAGRRCRHEIIAAVLEYLSTAGRARISSVALHANMPLDRARVLMGELQFYGLVESITDERGRRYYRVSERGMEYLRLWRRLRLLAGY